MAALAHPVLLQERLGSLYLTQQRYAESASATESGLKLNDHDYMVWSNLVLVYEWLNNKDKAEAARRRVLGLLEQQVKMQPQDASAQAALAALNAHYGRASQAESQIQTALAIAPEDPNVLADVATAYELLGQRGKICFAEGELPARSGESRSGNDGPHLRSKVSLALAATPAVQLTSATQTTTFPFHQRRTNELFLWDKLLFQCRVKTRYKSRQPWAQSGMSCAPD